MRARDGDRVPIAYVVVTTALDADGKLQVNVTGDEKKGGGAGRVKPAALAKSAKAKVTWQW